MNSLLWKVTVCVLGIAFSSSAVANLLSNPGFEIQESTDGEYPSVAGNWEGDISEIVSTENGISPFERSNMLKFIYAAGDYGAYTTIASQVRQTIDLSSYSQMISSGTARADLSAYFNRVQFDLQTDTEFAVCIAAFQGDIDNYVNLARDGLELAMIESSILTDSDIATWEMAQAQMIIPSNADFLAIQVIAYENIFNDYSGVEFDGHYCDQVSLEIIPEPATLFLTLLGGVFLRRKK